MINTNTNYSNDCLYVLKEQMRECVTSSYLDLDCDDIFSALTCDIDINKFKTWLDFNLNTFKSKQNIQTYFKKAFYKEVDRGTFKPTELKIDVSSLVRAMKDKGIVITTDDPLYLEIMWEEIFKAGIKEDVVINLNRLIVGYMEKGQDFKMYLYYVKHSNALKGLTIDWDKIDREYEKELACWKRILNELSLEALPND